MLKRLELTGGVARRMGSLAPSVRSIHGRAGRLSTACTTVARVRSMRAIPAAAVASFQEQISDTEKHRLSSPEALPAVTADSQSPISWTARWWPVTALDSLDPKLPLHVDLLGMQLAVWADSKGEWHCVTDRCPHRLAPLSEGRVKGDALQCSYHGWTFQADGTCGEIPQLSAEASAAACANPRACVDSYPTASSSGLLWVWPEPMSTNSALPSPVSQPVPEPAFGEGRTVWFARDVPLRYDTLLENVLDPSHVPFAHHGLQGNRDAKIEPREMTVDEITRDGFVTQARQLTARGNVDIVFRAPFNVTYQVVAMGGLPVLEIMVVPTKPGWSRLLANFPKSFPKVPAFVKAIMWLKNLHPAYDHIMTRNGVIDGDTYMLHVAERLTPTSKGIGVDVTKQHFMPAAVDRPVVALRQWLQRWAGTAVPTCEPDAVMPQQMRKEEVLDRFHQHTVNCKHCTEGLLGVERAIFAAVALGFLSVCTAIAQAINLLSAAAGLGVVAGAGVLARSPPMVWSLVLAVLCVVSFHKLQQIRAKFIYEPYVHALRD